MDKAQYAELENITVRCDTGYTIVGPPNIICSENRTWYPEIPNCKMVSGTIWGPSAMLPLNIAISSQGSVPDYAGVTWHLPDTWFTRYTLITLKHHGEIEGVGFSALWLDPEL